MPSFKIVLLLALVSLHAACVSADPTLATAKRVDVRSHGVRPDTNADSTSGIVAAVAAAKASGAIVYLPEGTYRYESFTLDGVRLVGAGAGKTILLAPDPALQKIKLAGTAPGIFDLTLLTEAERRVSGQDAIHVVSGTRDFEISRIDINGSRAAGIIVHGGQTGRITGNRLINTRADSIHITRGSTAIYVAGNLIRNPGDDCIAVVSYGGYRVPCRDVLIENNDVGEQYWGRGIAVVGGEQITIRNNSIRNTAGAGLYVASEQSYKTYGVADVVLRDNRLHECPFDPQSSHSAITVASSTDHWVEQILISGNKVTDAHSGPIRVNSGQVRGVVFRGNNFPAPKGITGSAGSPPRGALVTAAVLGGEEIDRPDVPAGFGEELRRTSFTVPAGTPEGTTLGDLKLRKTTGARVTMLKSGADEFNRPGNQQPVKAGDRLNVTGTPSQLAAVERHLNTP